MGKGKEGLSSPNDKNFEDKVELNYDHPREDFKDTSYEKQMKILLNMDKMYENILSYIRIIGNNYKKRVEELENKIFKEDRKDIRRMYNEFSKSIKKIYQHIENNDKKYVKKIINQIEDEHIKNS